MALWVPLRTYVGNFLGRTAFGWDLEGKTLVNPTVWDTYQQGPIADGFRVSGFGFRVSGLGGMQATQPWCTVGWR